MRESTTKSELAVAAPLKNFIANFPETLTACQDMGEKLEKIREWADILDYPEILNEIVVGNYKSYKSEVEGAAEQMLEYWDTSDYFSSGMGLANIGLQLIGPVLPDQNWSQDLPDDRAP